MNKTKKVYLVYTSNNKLYPHFPSSSLALAAELRKAQYQPVIIDTALEKWKKYDFRDALFVGISTFTGAWIKTGLEVARQVRNQNPDIPIFWGGPQGRALPEVTARHELVDLVCYGEGEQVIIDLANTVYSSERDYAKIKGVMYKNAQGEVVKTAPAAQVDMDAIELPPYDLLNLNNYPITAGRVYYQTSRGCVFKCRFCSYDLKMRWRGRSAEKVITDLEKIIAIFHPEEIQFLDGFFFGKIERVKNIAREKIRKRWKFRWHAFCRFDTLSKLDDDTVQLLADSGCFRLQLGGESASPEVLEYLDKRIEPEQIYDGVEKCRRHGINPTLSFMTGIPVESITDFYATINLMDYLRQQYPGINITPLGLLRHYPGTALTEEVFQKYNIPRPNTLEGWIKFGDVQTRRVDYPWMNKAEYNLRHTLCLVSSYIFFSDTILNLPPSQKKGTILQFNLIFILFKFFDKFMRYGAYWRWQKRIVAFPFEWRLWDLIRIYVIKSF